MRPRLKCFDRLIFATALAITVAMGCVELDKNLAGDPETKPPVGIATFAIFSPQFKCGSFLAATQHIPELHLSVLMQSFGQDVMCLSMVAMTNRLKSVQFHLVNEVCIRNNNCFQSREVFAGPMRDYEELVWRGEGWLIQRIQGQANKVAELVNYLEIENCYVSMGLESNLPPEVMDGLISRITLPSKCKVVFNPVDDVGRAELADFYEHHAGEFPNTTPECLVNNDGTHIMIGEVVNYPRKMTIQQARDMLDRSNSCELRFLWAASYSNCIGLSEEFIYPHKRDCPNWSLTQPLIGLLQ